MRRSTLRFVTLALSVLACGLWGARAEPPISDPAAVSSSESIREFREGWGMFGDAASLDAETYGGLIARMEWLVTELGRSGGAGPDVLVEHLLTPTLPVLVRGPVPQVRMPYTRVKIAIADTAAEFGLRQAIPALAEVVFAGELEKNTLAFEAYRRLAVPAADALAALDGREAVPALRAAFDYAFEGSRGASSMPRLRQFPAALVALGDNSWLEDRLIELLNGANQTSRRTAAFVAQHTRGEKIVPHLIDYLRETESPKAEWALRQISGQSYPGSQSWEAWWELNAARHRYAWTGLPPSATWKAIWVRNLVETIRVQFLCNAFTCWRKAGYPEGSFAAAVLEIAQRVHALEVEASIVESLKSQLGNHSGASCCTVWSSWDPQRRSLAPEPDSYCACDGQRFRSDHGTVAEHAAILLNAIACVEDTTLCGDWNQFDHSVNVATAVAPAAPAPGGQPAELSEDLVQDRDVSFEILPAVREKRSSEGYVVGEPISIRCVWRNAREWPVSVDLKDHDDHHGTLDYPVSLSARVLDSAGTVLTENEIADHGWWSSYFLWSTTFEKMPGDVVTLQPGEEVVRIVPLDKVLRGLDAFPDGLSEGTYVIRLSLGIGSVVSNQLEIEILGE